MAKAEPIPDDLARVRRLLARERGIDRGAWLRLSGWGVAAVTCVTIAAYAYEISGGFRRDNATSADLIRELRLSQQALQQQLQTAAKDAQTENKRLTGELKTLGADRDRLYTRVSTLEQSLESVTGSLNRQAAALATAAGVPFTPPVQTVASAPAAIDSGTKAPDTTAALGETPATRTVFGIDLAAGSSLDALRTAWRREAAASNAVAALQPIVVIRDRGASGMSLHLVAGPLGDAAEAARLCASLGPRDKACEPAAYEGQRLALDVPEAAAPTRARAVPKKKSIVRRKPVPRAAATPPPPRT